jgi:putative FmdB family regulatory protein
MTQSGHARSLGIRSPKRLFVEEWVPTYQYRCEKCGNSFERIESMAEHENAKAKCPKCDSKKVTQVPGRIHVVTSKKS